MGVIWPTMELMVKMAKLFEVSVDFLIREDLEIINDLPEQDQEIVISFLDAFIKRKKFEELINDDKNSYEGSI